MSITRHYSNVLGTTRFFFGWERETAAAHTAQGTAAQTRLEGTGKGTGGGDGTSGGGGLMVTGWDVLRGGEGLGCTCCWTVL